MTVFFFIGSKFTRIEQAARLRFDCYGRAT
jgi:hypothetical protein